MDELDKYLHSVALKNWEKYAGLYQDELRLAEVRADMVSRHEALKADKVKYERELAKKRKEWEEWKKVWMDRFEK